MAKKKIVSIIGTGVIGAGWAARFIASGHHVQAYDPSPRSLIKLKTDVKKALISLSKIGLHKNASIKNLTYHNNLKDALKDTSFVQENAPEKEKLKTSLLKEIDQLLDKKILIASSSSGLLPTKIQSKCKFPNRVLIGHPFNPVYLLPLVEIVKGKKTSQQSALKLKKIYESIGMKPLMVRKEIEGYISDRLQEALWRESLHLIKDGIASTEEIDDAIVYGPGLRWAFMGVCLTFHLAGGEEGMKHMLEQFGPALKLPWTKLKAPELNKKLKGRMISGTKKQAGKFSINDLEKQRDLFLIEIMKTLNNNHKNMFPNWGKKYNSFK
ncbi:3-hydroxyacyl-CoA dehydrogenase NAD-binding domain-containing protein [Pelagibacteraceae bacterium]|jgi:carnitine 3-dehydrogenase|nr:3-hydroxyacyl-CoA dehydrogenase NAD-binding domain-containing protein [Pelagibacteraceae bacterium]|tara:strand:- start:202 stop:1176 length:975 start_codon:yes stop_codon:yes gene_type:complete